MSDFIVIRLKGVKINTEDLKTPGPNRFHVEIWVARTGRKVWKHKGDTWEWASESFGSTKRLAWNRALREALKPALRRAAQARKTCENLESAQACLRKNPK